MAIGKYLGILAALAPGTGTSVRSAEAPLTLEPTSPWVADFKDQSCAVRRSFAAGDNDLVLEFDNFSLGEYFTVSLISSTLVPANKIPKSRFSTDDKMREHPDALIRSYDNGRRGIAYADTVFLRTQKQTNALFITDGFKQDLVVHTGSLEKALGVVKQCIDDLLIAKGLDPKLLKSVSRAPAGKRQMDWAVATQRDYPTALAREHKGATVSLRLLIDENGKVIDCAAQPNGEDLRFDVAACQSAFKYAQFDPARDANGNAVKAFFSTRLLYFPD